MKYLLPNRNTWHVWVCGVVLVYSGILQFTYIHGYHLPPDMYRDFLVARNIAFHGQGVLLGPWNGVFGGLASPLYNYLLAFPVRIYPSLDALSVVNIFWQLAGALFLFVAGKKLFSPLTGLLACILYLFCRTVLQQGLWVFQPFVMVPFVYASFACYAAAYRDEKYRYLILGSVCSALAVVVHNAAVPLLPLSVIASYIITRTHGWRWQRFIISIEVLVLVCVFAYVPTLVFYRTHGGWPMSGIFTFGISQYLTDLWNNFVLVTHLNTSLFYDATSAPLFGGFLPTIAVICLLDIAVWYYASGKILKQYKYAMGLLCFALLLPVIIGSLVAVPMYARRFVVMVGPAALIVAELIRFLWNRGRILRMASMVLFGFFITVWMYQPKDFAWSFAGHENRIANPYVGKVIADSASHIASEHGFSQYSFFQLYVYPDTPSVNTWSNAEYWLQVEQELQAKLPGAVLNFTRNDDSALGLGYTQTGTDEYVYVICVPHIIEPLTGEDCLQYFLATHSTHTLVAPLYNARGYFVYLTQRKVHE